MKEKSQSYRLWSRAIKSLRQYERKNKLEKNISKTILHLLFGCDVTDKGYRCNGRCQLLNK